MQATRRISALSSSEGGCLAGPIPRCMRRFRRSRPTRLGNRRQEAREEARDAAELFSLAVERPPHSAAGESPFSEARESELGGDRRQRAAPKGRKVTNCGEEGSKAREVWEERLDEGWRPEKRDKEQASVGARRTETKGEGGCRPPWSSGFQGRASSRVYCGGDEPRERWSCLFNETSVFSFPYSSGRRGRTFILSRQFSSSPFGIGSLSSASSSRASLSRPSRFAATDSSWPCVPRLAYRGPRVASSLSSSPLLPSASDTRVWVGGCSPRDYTQIALQRGEETPLTESSPEEDQTLLADAHVAPVFLSSAFYSAPPGSSVSSEGENLFDAFNEGNGRPNVFSRKGRDDDSCTRRDPLSLVSVSDSGSAVLPPPPPSSTLSSSPSSSICSSLSASSAVRSPSCALSSPLYGRHELSGAALLKHLEGIPWIGGLLQEVHELEANRDRFPSAENEEKLRVWWRSHAIRLFISGLKAGCAGDPALQLRTLRLALSFTPLAAAVPYPLDLPPAFLAKSPSSDAERKPCRARDRQGAAEPTELARFSFDSQTPTEEAPPQEPETGAFVVTQADVDAFGPAFVVFTQLPSLPVEQRLWCLDQFAFFFVHNCLCATVRQADEATARTGEKRERHGRGEGERRKKLKKEDIFNQVTSTFRVSSSGHLIVSDARLWDFFGYAVRHLGQAGYFDVAAHLTFSLLSLVYDIRAFPAPRPATPAPPRATNIHGNARATGDSLDQQVDSKRVHPSVFEGGRGPVGSDAEASERARQAENIEKRNNRWKLPKNVWLQILAARHDSPLAASPSASSGGVKGTEAGNCRAQEILSAAFEPQEIAAADMVDELFLLLKREVAEAAPLLARALLLEPGGSDRAPEGTGDAAQKTQRTLATQFASQFMSETERNAKHRAFARIRDTAVVKRATGMHWGNVAEEVQGEMDSLAAVADRSSNALAAGTRRTPWQVITKKNALEEQRRSVGGGWYYEKPDAGPGVRSQDGGSTEGEKEETAEAITPSLQGEQDTSVTSVACAELQLERAELERSEFSEPPFSPPFGFSSLLWYLRLESIFYRTQDIDLSSIVYRVLTHLVDHEVPQFLFPPPASRPSAAVAPATPRVAPLSSLFAAAPAHSFSLSRRGATTLAHAVGALKATRRYEHDLLRALCDALRPNLGLLSTPLACETMYNLGCLGYSDPAFAHALARHLASSGVLRHATVDSMMQLLIGFSRLEFRDDTLTEACIKGLLFTEGDRKKKAMPDGGQANGTGGVATLPPSATPAASLEETLYQERQAGANAPGGCNFESRHTAVSSTERNNKIMQTSVDLLARTHRPQSLFYLLHSISRNFVRSLPLLASLLPALQRFATAVPSNVAVLAFHDLVKMGIWPGPFRKAILSTLVRDLERHSLIPLAASTILTWSLWGHFDVPLFLLMAYHFHKKVEAGDAFRGDAGEEPDDAKERGRDAREKKSGKWGSARSVTSIKVSTQFWSSAYGLNLLALTPRDFVQHVNAVDRQIHLDLLDKHRRQSAQQNAFLPDPLPSAGRFCPSDSSTAALASDPRLTATPSFSPFSATSNPMRLFPRCRHSTDALVRFSPWQTGSLEGLKAARLLDIPEENWIPKSSSFHAEVVASCPPFLRDRVINEQPAGPYEIDVALPADAVDAWKKTQRINELDDAEKDEEWREPRRKNKKGRKTSQKT
ncbi:hypothetical protein TGME49_205190 [Toxoplasma gondii ME49]|uniref:Uncharacterized protein n=1 Tax=Toxoplasma gondii (strain ATCC 50611 / Me49) TaxID=508771 RepID=S8GDU4_TOXGM|nr:hypothetical protein TGME49_205190 [Toxoplasma gondii ME49]EPT29995.1 hypothetical protein TGME49_205190 [Toxoplasma gondii ME49]|eukprot:XP_018637287.1 hypothetical protein TGME49_205190 [Toxoplasma gondii ME49]